MNHIDLRSDTVTHPSPEMRKAMYDAELGDDVYGEDPTVNRLEELCAARLGKEAALFVPTGTMGNLAALLTHCGRGDEAIVGRGSHIFEHEQGSAATLGGIFLKPIPNEKDGTICLDAIVENISPDDEHLAITRLIAMENAFNGSVLSVEYTQRFVQLGKERGLATHLDGARVFNAAVALGVEPKRLVDGFDSVQLCFSKGLSAPAGSAIASTKEFVKRARRWRKALGGGMRQIGVVAAACIVALDKMVDRLAEDHETAKALAEKIADVAGIEVDWNRNQSNMVWFDVVKPGMNAEQFAVLLEGEGVKVLAINARTIRAVTHYGVTMDDITKVADAINRVMKQGSAASVVKASLAK